MIIQRGKNSYCYRSLQDGKKEYVGKITTSTARAFLAAQKQKKVEEAQRNKMRTERDGTRQAGEHLANFLHLVGRTHVLLHGWYTRKSELRPMKGILHDNAT